MSTAVKPAYQPHTIVAQMKSGETVYYVSSSDNSRYYTVRKSFGHLACTCVAGQHHKACKHIAHVATKLNEQMHKPSVVRQAERVAAKAERALPVDRTPAVFSIWKS